MTENPETAPVPEATEVLESQLAEEAFVPSPAKPRFPRRRIAAIAGSVLLVAAVVGGVGYTVVTVQDADRDPGKPTWRFPAAAAEDKQDDAKSGTTMSALLLPFGTDGSQRGPDMAEFGADKELSGEQATALYKESLEDLPADTRRQMAKEIDKQDIKGLAMRSYVFGYADYNTKDMITIEVTLERLEDRTAVRRLATSFNKVFADLDVFRKGPEIKEHEDARCFLTPKGKAKDLGLAFCTGYVGDVLVSASAYAPDPVDGKFVTEFFASQLDRIDDPGQAV